MNGKLHPGHLPRLQPVFYQGDAAVHWTLTLFDRGSGWLNDSFHLKFRELLLQVAAREGYTQLDPQKSGIRQKGVLGFRALQVPATLALDIEQVDPWIQVTSLQHAAISEAQVKVKANLQYQIENAGLKSLRLLLPANADGVRFQGDQV